MAELDVGQRTFGGVVDGHEFLVERQLDVNVKMATGIMLGMAAFYRLVLYVILHW